MSRTTQLTVSETVMLLVIFMLLPGFCLAQTTTGNPPTINDTDQVPSKLHDVEEPFELEDEFTANDSGSRFDPLSGYNRVMTVVNDKVYFWLLRPVAKGYGAVVPEGARLAVGRFFSNLLMPVRFVNNLLQFKLKQAGTELARFGINTTIGVLGFGDPATNHFGLKTYPEDFGQTLGFYGVGSGFHIVLPLLGPSNLRDTISLVPDHYLDPVNYLDGFETRLAVRVYDRVNYTSLHLGEYESLKKDAIDLYPFLRDSYEQRRLKLIED